MGKGKIFRSASCAGDGRRHKFRARSQLRSIGLRHAADALLLGCETTLGIYAQSVEESERRAMIKLEELRFPNVPTLGGSPEGGPKLVN